MANKRYSKFKMFLLYALCLLVNLLPLIIVLIIHWEVCTKTRREGIALSVTGIAWLIFLITTMIGSMPKKMNRVVVLIVVFIVLKLMQPLLDYMTIFSGAAAIGALIDLFAVKPFINRYRELRVATKTADITTQQIKEVLKDVVVANKDNDVKNTSGTGRV